MPQLPVSSPPRIVAEAVTSTRGTLANVAIGACTAAWIGLGTGTVVRADEWMRLGVSGVVIGMLGTATIVTVILRVAVAILATQQAIVQRVEDLFDESGEPLGAYERGYTDGLARQPMEPRRVVSMHSRS